MKVMLFTLRTDKRNSEVIRAFPAVLAANTDHYPVAAACLEYINHLMASRESQDLPNDECNPRVLVYEFNGVSSPEFAAVYEMACNRVTNIPIMDERFNIRVARLLRTCLYFVRPRSEEYNVRLSEFNWLIAKLKFVSEVRPSYRPKSERGA